MASTHSVRPALCRWILALCALAPVCAADRLVTTDGRVLEVKKARVEGQGYRLTFEHGEIVLADRALVKAVEIEGDMSEYVPKDATEKANLEKGYVKYGGAWMSKPAYQNKLAEEHAKSAKRTAEMELHSDFDNAWTKETAHFAIRTNTSAELLEYYADLLETYYSLMDNRFGIDPSPSLRRTKMAVNIYKNRAEFHELNSAGVGGGVAGYFSPGEKSLNFYHDYAEPEISNWVCLHECTHLLTFLIDPQYVPQIWVNEGVADYFGSAEIVVDKKGKLTIASGRLQTDRVLTVQQAIQEGNDVKLEELFTVSRDEFDAFEYSHAWSFVYFLNQTPKYKKGFDRFFKDLYTLAKGITFEVINYASFSGGTGKQVPPQEIRRVLLHSLGVKDVAVLEKEWKDFVAKVPIESGQARFKRAYRMVMQGAIFSDAKDPEERSEQFRKNLEQTLGDLDAAIASGITDPRAYFARFTAKGFRGASRGPEGEESRKADLLKAIELDPLNARYRFALGNLLSGDRSIELGDGDARITTEVDGPPGEVVPEAAAAYGLAMNLAPENPIYKERFERYTAKK